MADRNSTAVINDFDQATAKLNAAKAIIDCAKALTALERASETRVPGDRLTGHGYAAGYKVRDDSLPEALAHAVSLVDQALNHVDVIREIAMTALKGESR